MRKNNLLLLLITISSFYSFGQNNSIDFDGQNDRIFVNSSTGWNSANALTVEAWIYADAWRANHWEGSIVAKDQNNQSGYVLRCGNNGTLSFVVGVGNGVWTEVLSAPVMQTNTWHHVAGVMDNGTLRLYIDGVASGTMPSNPIAVSTNSVYIGESSGFPGRVFNGRIDEVRVWDTVRTQTQIMNSMTVNIPGTTPNLLAYYQMDTIINNTITNEVSTTSTGVLQNFSATSPLVGGYVVPTLDFGVSSIESPDLITLFQKYSKVKAKFKNFGNDTIYSLTIGYRLNNVFGDSAIVTHSLLPGEVYEHTFSNPLPKMDSATQITVFTSLPGDINPVNNSITLDYAKPGNPSTLEIPIFVNEQHNFGAAGQNHFSDVVLPEDNLNYSRILLEISVACPGSGCDPWDQPAKISIIKDGQTHEIARYVTPYGKACGPWTVDVTDFKTLLRGNTSFASYIQVWGQSGWLLNAKLIYDNTPATNPYQRLTSLWNTDYWVYGDPAVSYNLPAQTILVDSNSNEVNMRMTISGHGQGNTSNAAEFSQFTHQVTANGINVNNHTLWKNDCNLNSCSNQFGTWTLSRAGWCPGQAVDPYYVNLASNVPTNRNLTVDYVLQTYTNNLRTGYNGGSHTEPHYKIHAYLVEKSDHYIDTATFTDIAATEITSPTLATLSSNSPVKVMLRNYGSVDVTFPTATLWINGNQVATQTVPNTLLAGDSLEHTFNYNANFVSGTSYNIVVDIHKPMINDQVASNDVTSVFIDQAVGIEEEITPDLLSLYPNPAERGFVIAGENLSGQVGVRIITIQGQEVYNELRTVNGKIEVDEPFDAGIYFVEIKINGQFIRKRVVIL